MSTIVQTIPGGKAWYTPPTGPMTLGEAPIYRSSDSTLHWVDCLKEPPELHILKVDPESGDPIGEARVLILEDSVSVMSFRKEVPGSYICAYYGGVAFLSEQTGELEIVREIIPGVQRDERRFNDGGVDAQGRFWLAEIDTKAAMFGLGQVPKEYGEPRGRLWRYDPDGSLHEMASGLICGNGVKWSLDNKTFYLDDSMGQKTYAYDFDLETGGISNKRILIDFAGTCGEPDGMVIDSENNLWIAVYGSNRVMIYNPSGRLLREIEFSGKNMTCPTFGGKNLDLLFVTSGRKEPNEADEGGSLFKYKLEQGTRGTEKYQFGM